MARRQGMMYAGGTPDFDERTGEPTGDAKPAKNVKGTAVDPLANDEVTIPEDLCRKMMVEKLFQEMLKTPL